MQKIARFSICLIVITFFGYQSSVFQAKDPLSFKRIHYYLFDLYFPGEDLSYLNKTKRVIYKEIVWHKIKHNHNLINLIEPIIQARKDLPEELKVEMDSIVRKIIFDGKVSKLEKFKEIFISNEKFKTDFLKLRQTWLYITYSLPLIYDLANIDKPEENKIYNVSLDLPDTKLYIEIDQIKHQDGELDYLIIGSGPAGSVISHELTRKVKRVLLIDTGPFIKPQSLVTESMSELIESKNQRRDTTGSIIIRNGQAVGGGTVVNLDLAFSPLLPSVKKSLHTWDLPENFFHDKQGDWQKLENAYQWVKAHVKTRPVEKSEINLNNAILKNGSPYSKTYDLNARKKGNVKKISATEAFIIPAMYKGLSLLSGAKAEKIMFDSSGLATGATIAFVPSLTESYVRQNSISIKSEKQYIIHAKKVIVCSGTLGSAALLLKSKIKNDNIGKGIVIHPSIPLAGEFNYNVDVHQGLPASVYASSKNGEYFFESMSALPSYVALMHPGCGKDILQIIRNYRKIGGFGIMLIDTPHKKNRVFLANNKTEVEYSLDEEDKKRLKSAVKDGVKILFEQGATEVFIPVTEKIYLNKKHKSFTSCAEAEKSIDLLTFDNGFGYLSTAHMQSSNKLGNDPDTSVVSSKFKIWNNGVEVENLYVCDSSIFPKSVGANPMQSIYTIAKLFSDQLGSAPHVN